MPSENTEVACEVPGTTNEPRIVPLKSEIELSSAPRQETGVPHPTFSASVGDDSSNPLDSHSVPSTSRLEFGSVYGMFVRSSKVMSVANALFIHSSATARKPLRSFDTMTTPRLLIGN